MPDCLNMIKDLPDNVTTFNHVDDEMFVNLVSSARNIICRGGYSSLMDLIRLNRSAFLIPTPGQTEQEYLSQYLFKKDCSVIADKKTSISKMLQFLK